MDEDMDLNIQEDDSENEEIPLPPPRKPKMAPSSSSASLPPQKKTQTVIKKDLTTVPGQKQKSQPQKPTSSVVAQRTRSNSTLEAEDADSRFSQPRVTNQNGSSSTDKKNALIKKLEDSANAVSTSSPVVSEKRTKRFGPEDDPMQFHARPQELSRYFLVGNITTTLPASYHIIIYNTVFPASGMH